MIAHSEWRLTIFGISIVRISCIILLLFIGKSTDWIHADEGDFENNRNKWIRIKSNATYFWGEGTRKTVEQAKDAASADLIKKIWVAISVNLNGRTIEKQEHGDINLTSEWTEDISSHLTLSLTGLRHLVVEGAEGVRVLAYITVGDLRTSLYKRKSEILDYVEWASGAERRNDIGKALKDYYRAFLLSHTYPDTIGLELDGVVSNNPSIAIAGKIRSVLTQLEISSREVYRDGGVVIADLLVKYTRSPVSELNVSYYSGLGTDYAQVIDGQLTLPLYDEPTYPERDIDLSVDYVGAGELSRNPELWQIHEHLDGSQFSNTVTVGISFPWLSGRCAVVDSSEKEADLSYPNAIRVLGNIQNRDDFLRILNQYKRLHSIDFGRSPQLPEGQDSYIAIMDSVSIWGLFYFDGEIYREVSSGRKLLSLSDEFAGKRQVWIYRKHPQSDKLKGDE